MLIIDDALSQVFKSLLTAYCSLLTAYCSLFSNTKPRNRRLVLLGIRIREQTLLELVQLPNFQVCQITEYCHIADDLRALSEQRMNQHASLRVHRRLLAVVVRPVKELSSRRIPRRQPTQTLL